MFCGDFLMALALWWIKNESALDWMGFEELLLCWNGYEDDAGDYDGRSNTKESTQRITFFLRVSKHIS